MSSTSKMLLRVFVGEADKIGHTPLYEAIVRQARDAGLEGATVWRGVLSYGHSSHLHTRKILELSADMPMVIEIVEDADKLQEFMEKLQHLFTQSGSKGLATLEQVQAVRLG